MYALYDYASSSMSVGGNHVFQVFFCFSYFFLYFLFVFFISFFAQNVESNHLFRLRLKLCEENVRAGLNMCKEDCSHLSS